MTGIETNFSFETFAEKESPTFSHDSSQLDTLGPDHRFLIIMSQRCMVCLEQFKQSSCRNLVQLCLDSCHQACPSCFTDALLSAMRSSPPELPLRCLGRSNDVNTGVDRRCSFMLDDKLIRRLLPSVYEDEYERAVLAAATLFPASHQVFLSTPCCQRLFEIDRRDCRIVARVLPCPYVCRASMCTGCDRQLTMKEEQLVERQHIGSTVDATSATVPTDRVAGPDNDNGVKFTNSNGEVFYVHPFLERPIHPTEHAPLPLLPAREGMRRRFLDIEIQSPNHVLSEGWMKWLSLASVTTMVTTLFRNISKHRRQVTLKLGLGIVISILIGLCCFFSKWTLLMLQLVLLVWIVRLWLKCEDTRVLKADDGILSEERLSSSSSSSSFSVLITPMWMDVPPSRSGRDPTPEQIAALTRATRGMEIIASRPITYPPDSHQIHSEKVHNHLGPLCFRPELHEAQDDITSMLFDKKKLHCWTDDQLYRLFRRTLDAWAPQCPVCRRLGLKSGSDCNVIHCECGTQWCFMCSKQIHRFASEYVRARLTKPERTAFMLKPVHYMGQNQRVSLEHITVMDGALLDSINHHGHFSLAPTQHRHDPYAPGKPDTLCPSTLEQLAITYRLPEFVKIRDAWINRRRHEFYDSVWDGEPANLSSSGIANNRVTDGIELRLIPAFLRLRAICGLRTLQNVLPTDVFMSGLRQLPEWASDEILCDQLGVQVAPRSKIYLSAAVPRRYGS